MLKSAPDYRYIVIIHLDLCVNLIMAAALRCLYVSLGVGMEEQEGLTWTQGAYVY
jgi:hypothetical protein